MNDSRVVTAITENPTDLFQAELVELVEGEAAVPRARGDNEADAEARRRRKLQELFAGAECVDLVGHSTPMHRYLKLGDWVLDPSEAARLASYLPPTVKSVRLIGCGTASTEQGRAAIKALAESGLSAFGTKANIYMTHFDKKGVKRGLGKPPLRAFPPSGERLAAAPDQPAVTPPSPPASREPPSPPASQMYAPGLTLSRRGRVHIPLPLAWIGRCALAVIAVPLSVLCWLYWLCGRLFATRRAPRRWIWWLLSSRGAPMQGLLTEPLLTYELTSGRSIWTLEILFDFEYARFYSDAHAPARKARVYRIRGSRRVAKAVLETYLEMGPPGVRLIDRHEEAGDRGGELVGRQAGPKEAAPPPSRPPGVG